MNLRDQFHPNPTGIFEYANSQTRTKTKCAQLVGRTAPTAKRRPLLQFLLDHFAAMLEFDQRYNFGSWSSLPDQCHARGLAVWVDL
jgi:hypothetical protein